MDQYERERIVGRGAHGTVYLCKRKRDAKPVIIKQIPMEQMSVVDRQATINEVKVLAMLRHPNIVEYYDSFLHEQAMMIVMEYAAGGTLFDLLEARANQGEYLDEEEEIAYLFAQIVLPLHLVHSNHILHRDLKSQNIFLTRTKDTVKIGDFGISKILSSKSKAYTVVGTPSYISPELCEGRPYNQKSDVWSLGCILYEMCALKRAFEAPTLPALVLKIMRGSVQPLPDHYSANLKNLVASMLQLNPSSRPELFQVMCHPWLAPHLYRLPTTMGSIPCTAKPPRPLSATKPQDLNLPPESPFMARRRSPSPFSRGLVTTNVVRLKHDGTDVKLLPMGDTSYTVTQVCSSGETDTLGVTDSGKAIIWCGRKPTTIVARPLDTLVGIAIRQVCGSPGNQIICMLTDRGILMTKGKGSDGCLGHGYPLESLRKPRIVEALLGEEVTSVACSDDHVVAVTSDHEVFAWGRNQDGCLGIPGKQQKTIVCQPIKVQLKEKLAIKKAICGPKCSALLTNKGQVWVAGRNRSNRLALDGVKNGRVIEATDTFAVAGFNIKGSKNVKNLAFGPYHSIVVTEEDHVAQYGPNKRHQVLINLDQHLEERQVNFVATSSSKEHSNVGIVVTGRNRVHMWKIEEEEEEDETANKPFLVTFPPEICGEMLTSKVVSVDASKLHCVIAYATV